MNEKSADQTNLHEDDSLQEDNDSLSPFGVVKNVTQ